MEAARQEAEGQIAALQEELAGVRRTLTRLHQPLDALQEIEDKVSELEEKTEAPVEVQQPEYGPELRKLEKQRRRSIQPGDRVRIRSLGAQGVVTSLNQDEAELQVGILRIRARLSDLDKPSPSGASAVSAMPRKENFKAEPKPEKREIALPESPGMELDLRGQRADDAEFALEHYLDAAFLAGLPFVRIIHGKGTGRLRELVRVALKDHPQVLSFEAGGDKEGGEGVTVARLAVG